MNNSFVATGARRLVVALVAIVAIALVDTFAMGISKWASIGIGVVTLGYYNTKYAEVFAPIVHGVSEKFFGKVK